MNIDESRNKNDEVDDVNNGSFQWARLAFCLPLILAFALPLCLPNERALLYVKISCAPMCRQIARAHTDTRSRSHTNTAN